MTCKNCKDSTSTYCPQCISEMAEQSKVELSGWKYFDEKKRVGVHLETKENALYVRIVLPDNQSGMKVVMEKVKKFVEDNFYEPNK